MDFMRNLEPRELVEKNFLHSKRERKWLHSNIAFKKVIDKSNFKAKMLAQIIQRTRKNTPA